MSECCMIPHAGDVPTCPMNGQPTRPVGRKTIESLVKPEVRADLTSQPYHFCDAPDCDTVYVSTLGDHLITKDMLTVRVGIKETDDPHSHRKHIFGDEAPTRLDCAGHDVVLSQSP